MAADVVVVPAGELAEAGAELVAVQVAADPEACIMPATGRTPMGVYAHLAGRAGAGLETSRLRVAQLDEYVGVESDDPRSLRGWMERSFVEPLGIPPERVLILDGTAGDLAAECRRFDGRLAEEGGVDLAILGLGPNGHVGFNEPPSGPTDPTREVSLAEASIASNAAYWGGPDRVPRRALTAGMATVLAARRVLLIVAGEHKHRIVREAVAGPVTDEVPASHLQGHPNLVALVDETAWLGP